MQKTRLIDILIIGVYILGIFASIPLLFISFMLFDSPGSEDSILNNIAFYSIIYSIPFYIAAIKEGWKDRRYYLLGAICPILFLTALFLL